ncbi:DUF58 domain-containing protein [Cognatishimia maritima]|uniref:DUF58 domain-containing protein n=1 Tax=Cognatishimia maritima TaxID=870908 RepID=A0A1M5NR03_9RHOB|nr:DUF58 domain-containing protein [Cognatishimia maritima]SHG91875.1 Protein of unknown function DUF58 [Cognatishimia maritima]
MSAHPQLRRRAEAAASRFPPLLARAETLANTVLLGEHGRQRSGLGDDFWQYRPVQAGDSYRMIDWRKSAKTGAQYVRQKEWQIAQSITLWVDNAASMSYHSQKDIVPKSDRAQLLALAVAILMIRAGERVGLAGTTLPPRRGDGQIWRLSQALLETEETRDYGAPEARAMLPNTRALFISDFFGHFEDVEQALYKAADRGVRGVILQVLDPAEEAFPFSGRAIFESMKAQISHETRKANELQEAYLQRLQDRKAALQKLARITGWQYTCHLTDAPVQSALLWLYNAMERGR